MTDSVFYTCLSLARRTGQVPLEDTVTELVAAWISSDKAAFGCLLEALGVEAALSGRDAPDSSSRQRAPRAEQAAARVAEVYTSASPPPLYTERI